MSKSGETVVKQIVVNALQYKQNSSGIGVLIRELFTRYLTYTSRSGVVILSKDSPAFETNKKIKQIRSPWNYQQGINRMIFQTVILGQRYGKNSILLTTDSKIPFFIPKDCVLIPIITDLSVFRIPKAYRLSRVIWWRMQYRYMCRRANLFLTISNFTKKELQNILNIPDDKIRIVPCAAADYFSPVNDLQRLEELKNKYKLGMPFLLFVGNNNPRKNLKRMICAFDEIAEKIPHHLVIAGEQGWKFCRTDIMSSLRNPQKVHFIGYVPDEEMPALYSLTDLFLFPSLYEGFGIPILEAQQCGVPVLASYGSAMDEIGGDGAIYVNPYSKDSIKSGILKFIENPNMREYLVQIGLRNAKKYSWKKSAQILNQIIEKEIGQ